MKYFGYVLFYYLFLFFCSNVLCVDVIVSSVPIGVRLESELDKTIEELKHRLNQETDSQQRRKVKKQIRELEKQIKVSQKNKQKFYQQEIKFFRDLHGSELYVGEAVTYKSFNEEFGETIEKAKQRAINNLAMGIRVKIEAVVKDEINFTTGKPLEEKFNRVIKTYVDDLLTNIQLKVYEHYPKKNAVTVIAYISKKIYDEFLEKRLKAQIEYIAEYISKGLLFINSNMVVAALRSFIQAQKLLEKEFNYLPLQYDIDKDGKLENLTITAETKIFEILQRIKFIPPKENIFFNADGILRKNFVIKTVFVNNSTEIPVENLPVKVSVIKGAAAPSVISAVSNKLGEVEIKLNKVTAEMNEVQLLAEVDLDALDISSKLRYITPPGCIINLAKTKKVMLICSHFCDKIVKEPQRVKSKIISLLHQQGFETESLVYKNTKLTDSEFDNARDKKADYLVFINLFSQVNKLSEYDMFISNLNAKIEIYSVKDKELISYIENGLTSKGYGVDKENATSSAENEVSDKITRILADEIKKLR
ncbi:MAG: hypothetical protein N2643_04080 [Endomicrobia bacterium]|nr:hypothetical protein [Endomicrobiia bacterium]